MRVKLYMEDWMMTMGMVGLYRLLQDDIEPTPFGFSFDTEVLKKLPECFFNYMIKEYSIAERDKKIMEDNLKYARNEKYFKSNLQQIRKRMSEQQKKVEKYFPEEAKRLRNIVDAVKAIKKPDEYQLLTEQVQQYYDLMKSKKINEKLTINYFKKEIMSDPFFGQPSFLNVIHNAKSKQEQINLFYRDYVEPVLLEANLREIVENETNVDSVFDFLKENNHYQPFRGLLRAVKNKKTVAEIKAYLQEEMPQCAMIDGWFATSNFEEMIFSPLALSKEKAQNFNWNLQKNQPVPLSSLAKLVLFLAPVGVVFYNRKDGFDSQGEYRTYSGFVMSDDTFPEIVKKNETYRIKKKNEDPFDVVVHDLLQHTRDRAGKVMDTLLFIEVHSNYQSKKTLLDYYHMPNYIAYYFKRYGDNLRKIWNKEYREAFTRTALQGIEPISVVFRYLQAIIKRSEDGFSGFIAARELNRIQFLKKGVGDVQNADKKVYVIFKQGQEIRNKLIAERELRAAKTSRYTAEVSKKVNAIAYRLLNAAKAGNVKSFMDTLFRIHMAAEKEVSPIFLNALHEQELKFETVASAFIAGLLSADYQKELGKGASAQ